MKREPLFNRGLIISIVTAAIGVLLSFEVIDWTDAQRDQVLTLVSILAGPVAAAVLWLWGRQAVTPVHDPKDAEGNKLVKAS